MNQAEQGIITETLVDIPLKRKRGRPRKYPKLNLDGKVHISRHRGRKHLHNIPIPPVSGVNENQPNQEILTQNADGMLGQVVSGVIEAVFEAGYLLCVRVGNTGITLRGVVFKPGHYVPVSVENDVAPDAQMIRRNKVRSSGNHTHGHNPRSKNGKLGSKAPRQNKSAPLVSNLITHPGSSRGNVVPVVLQPAKLTNGTPVAIESFAIQTTHAENSKGKEVLTGTFPSNELALTGLAVGIESNTFQPQTNQPVLQDVSVENSSLNKSSASLLQDEEAKSMKLPSTPFENLVTEVIKRIQAPSMPEIQCENAKSTGKISASAKEFEDKSEAAANVMDEPLMIEPLKAVQPDRHDSSASIPKALYESRTGKMTELLQVLQENMMQHQEP